jgi:hypothetical protein
LTKFPDFTDAFLPIHQFWSETIDYFEFQRCGGFISHVNRMLGSEVNKAQGLLVSTSGSEQSLSLMSSAVPKRTGKFDKENKVTQFYCYQFFCVVNIVLMTRNYLYLWG